MVLFTHLAMSPANFEGRGESFIHIKKSTIHSSLLNGLAGKVQVVLNEYGENLIGNHLLQLTS